MAQVQLWSDDAMRDAIDRHQFILVTDTDSDRITILDLPALWADDPRLIFQTGYRIGGRPENIEAALAVGGVDSSDIDEIVASALTHTNYQTDLASIYTQELEDYTQWYRGAMASNWNAPGAKLNDLIVALNPGLGKVQSKRAIQQTPGAKSSTGGRHTVSLQERLDALPPGKFLDVSGLTPNGTGARTTLAPPPRSAKKGTPSLPIVSSDFEHYVLAIRMLEGGETTYQNEILYMKDVFKYDRDLPGIQPTIQPSRGALKAPPRIISPVRETRADLAPLQLYSTEEILAVEAKASSTSAVRKQIRERKRYEEFLERQAGPMSPPKVEPTPRSPSRDIPVTSGTIRIPSMPPPRSPAFRDTSQVRGRAPPLPNGTLPIIPPLP